MELTDQELKEFRERALQASQYGHEIGLAELYTEALAAEVGQLDVPHGVTKASAAHLFALADEALKRRAGEQKPAPEPVMAEADTEPPPGGDPKPEVNGEAPVVEVAAEEPGAEEPSSEEPGPEETGSEEPPKTEAEESETADSGPVSKKSKKGKK